MKIKPAGEGRSVDVFESNTNLRYTFDSSSRHVYSIQCYIAFFVGKPAEKKTEKKAEKKPATAAASTSKVTKPAAKPAAVKKPAAAKPAAAAKSAAKPAAKPVLKLASKPLISKPKKNVQATKKIPKGGKPAAPLQKALKAQKKVLETNFVKHLSS